MREAVATASPLRSRATTTRACSPARCRTAPPAQNAAPALARLLPGYRVQPPRVLFGGFVSRAAAARAARWPCLQARPQVALTALVRRARGPHAAGHRRRRPATGPGPCCVRVVLPMLGRWRLHFRLPRPSRAPRQSTPAPLPSIQKYPTPSFPNHPVAASLKHRIQRPCKRTTFARCRGTVGGGGAAKGNKGMWRGAACV